MVATTTKPMHKKQANSVAVVDPLQGDVADPLVDPLQAQEEEEEFQMQEEEEELQMEEEEEGLQMEEEEEGLQMEEEEEGLQMEEEEEELQAKGNLQKKDRKDITKAVKSATSDGGGALPHGDTIQEAFGGHDISGVKAHTGEQSTQANKELGSKGFTAGSDIAFKGDPSLHTAAHEAAHVVQQQGGVSLKNGVGEVGDKYEQHADAVADAVVGGKSAEGMLDQYSAAPAAQMKKEK